MMSERKLVCNNDTAIMRDMSNWPKGRTYVYGIAFEDGPMLVQQPVVKTRVVDAAPAAPTMPELPQTPSERAQELTGTAFTQQAKQPERAQELAGTGFDGNFSSSFELKNLLLDASRRYSDGESVNSILRSHGLADGGRNNQNLKMLLDGMTGTEE